LAILLYLLNLLAWIIATVTVAATALFVLRVIVAWVSKNPFGWLAYNLRRITEPIVRPIRQPFSGYYMRFDLLPLVAGAMILFTGLFISDVLWRIAGILGGAHLVWQYYRVTTGLILNRVILLLGLAYEAAIFVRVVLPWFGVGYSSNLLRFLYRITEPVLRPLRRLLNRFIPLTALDISPILALLLVRVVTGILADAVASVIK
jgi:YggT family protein